MKKTQIIATFACLLVGMAGFAGAYTMERSAQQEQQKEVAEVPSTEDLSQVSSIVKPQEKTTEINQATEVETETQTAVEKETTDSEKEEAEETAAKDNTIHFTPEDGLRWPLEGNVLLNYSMDHTIYFPTLEQFQYNPAIVIGGEINEKVYLVAKGTIVDISTNEETGCTVTQDLGDGYTAIYGQLKEVNFEVGDTVQRGQVIGYVSEPTKYYSIEGSNLYFAMEKDGEPINPLDYFE